MVMVHNNALGNSHNSHCVITDKQLNFLCAVELNDKSHDREDRIKRDNFLQEAFGQCRISPSLGQFKFTVFASRTS